MPCAFEIVEGREYLFSCVLRHDTHFYKDVQSRRQYGGNPNSMHSWGLDAIANLGAGWPKATSIRNMIPILLAVLKSCETLKNDIPDNF